MASAIVIPGVVDNLALAMKYEDRYLAARSIHREYDRRTREAGCGYIPSYRKPLRIIQAYNESDLCYRLMNQYLADAEQAERAFYG